jgi:uncharacterized protein (TIRG00374 family)
LDLRVIPIALGLHVLMQAFWALRLRVLAGGLGVALPYSAGFALVSSGLFAASVTPGRAGSEPWRIAMLMRRGAPGAAASRLVLADRASDMVFFLAMGSIVAALLPFLFPSSSRYQGLAFLAVFGLLTMMALIAWILVRPRRVARLMAGIALWWDRLRRRTPRDRSQRITEFFGEVTAGLAALARAQPMRLAAAAILALALWVSEFTILWVLLRGFGFDAPYFAVCAVGILIALFGAVPVAPGGSIVVEAAALALLTPLAPGLNPAFLIVWRGLTFYTDMLVGGAVASWIVARWRRPTPTQRPIRPHERTRP